MEENSTRTREMWKRESKCAEKDGGKRRWTKRKSTLEELVRAKKSCTLINSSLTEKRAITAPSRYHDYAHVVVKTVRRALKDRWFTGRVQWRRATMEIFREQFKKFTAFFSRDRPDKSDTRREIEATIIGKCISMERTVSSFDESEIPRESFIVLFNKLLSKYSVVCYFRGSYFIIFLLTSFL